MVASLINTVLVIPESILAGKGGGVVPGSLFEQLQAWTAALMRQGTRLETLARLVWILLSVFLMKNIVLYAKNMTAGVMENRLIRDLRNDLFAHIQSLSRAYFTHQRSAELASIVLNDVAPNGNDPFEEARQRADLPGTLDGQASVRVRDITLEHLQRRDT